METSVSLGLSCNFSRSCGTWAHRQYARFKRHLPDDHRPAYTTVQTMIYRLEEKGAVRRVKKVGNAHIFEALLTRIAVRKPSSCVA